MKGRWLGTDTIKFYIPRTTSNGPRQANLVLIAYASSEGSGAPARRRIRAVSPEPPLLAHTSSESREIFRQKARSLAPLNGWDAHLKFVMTECSKTQIRLTGLKWERNSNITTHHTSGQSDEQLFPSKVATKLTSNKKRTKHKLSDELQQISNYRLGTISKRLLEA